jgi:hypothetical protein
MLQRDTAMNLKRPQRAAPSKVKYSQVLVVLVLAAFAISIAAAPRRHKITVKFDYDFRLTPACSQGLTTKCVKRFNVYDISAGNRILLFSIPVPDNTVGFVQGISVTSPPLPFAPGKHTIAVTAQSADGAESGTNVCTVTFNVKR